MAFEIPKIATNDEGDAGFAGLCECGYKTTGWPNEEIASERISQHLAEHQSWIDNRHDPESWALMEPVEEFRERHGLVQDEENGSLAVFPEGSKEVEPPVRATPSKAKTTKKE